MERHGINEEILPAQEQSFEIPDSLLTNLAAISILPSDAMSEKSLTGRNSLSRNWKKLLLSFIVTIIVIVFGIVYLVLRPRKKNSATYHNATDDSDPSSFINPKKNVTYHYPSEVAYDKFGIPILPQLDSSFMIIDSSTFDNSKRPNDKTTPPIDQKFPYGDPNYKIRGVNIGGWLVLDPFIVPSLFNSNAPNETALVSSLSPKEAKRRLLNHYDQFITEDDFIQMRKFGLNHVRIPIGFWAIEKKEGENYVELASWQFLLRGINWARKQGIRVYVDLHVVPGGGQDGQLTEVEFVNELNNSPTDSARTLRMVKSLANFFKKSNYSDVVTLLGPVNEPVARNFTGNFTDFYLKAYNIIQDSYNDTNQKPYVILDEAHYGLKFWSNTDLFKDEKFKILGTHNYLGYVKNLSNSSDNEKLAYPCVKWKQDIALSEKDFSSTIVSEWAAATDDCAKDFNGFDTHSKSPNTGCPNCACQSQKNWESWTQSDKDYELALIELQMEAFEAGSGWFYWTWKTENNINPKWDYQLGVENGWIPKILDDRKFTCDLMKKQHPELF
ncbi:hypothetical protein G9A89_023384 [Geosiphon pyriformis]|nr:hypothetical protein G9A89_023384 [Geosiphon pyriformis]